MVDHKKLSERDPNEPAVTQGLFKKFEVKRLDGSDDPGGKHHGCEYFVLDLDHDPYARAVLLAYANACWTTYPKLAHDLRLRYGLSCTRCGGEMKPGQALESTLVGEPDDIGECVTVSPGGQGKLVPCMKCAECGWSVTVGESK